MRISILFTEVPNNKSRSAATEIMKLFIGEPVSLIFELEYAFVNWAPMWGACLSL